MKERQYKLAEWLKEVYEDKKKSELSAVELVSEFIDDLEVLNEKAKKL